MLDSAGVHQDTITWLADRKIAMRRIVSLVTSADRPMATRTMMPGPREVTMQAMVGRRDATSQLPPVRF